MGITQNKFQAQNKQHKNYFNTQKQLESQNISLKFQLEKLEQQIKIHLKDDQKQDITSLNISRNDMITNDGTKLNFREELENLINRHSMENNSDTPDFILTSYLLNCLEAFDIATIAREKWCYKELNSNFNTYKIDD